MTSENLILQETLDSVNAKNSQLQNEIIRIEGDSEKTQEIRKLEKHSYEQYKSASDLSQKVCQNCISSF